MDFKLNILFRILNNRKKRLNEGDKFELENCDYGMQNCVKVLQSKRAEECHLVSNENYYLLNLDESLKREVYEKLRLHFLFIFMYVNVNVNASVSRLDVKICFRHLYFVQRSRQ